MFFVFTIENCQLNSNDISFQSSKAEKNGKRQKGRSTIEQRLVIIGGLQAGLYSIILVNQYGVDSSTVRRIWGQYKSSDSINRKSGSGRPKKTIAVDDRYINLQV